MAIPRKKHKKKRLPYRKPELGIDQILGWVDDFQRGTGRWPNRHDGRIPLRNETWSAINTALHRGLRGLPGGSSLPNLLKVHRGVRNRADLPPLDEQQILKWARDHFRRTGTWPDRSIVAIPGAPGEKWSAINVALVKGARRLPGGSSLADFLKRHCGVRNVADLPPLNERRILKWARDHFRRTGTWPNRSAGTIPDAPDEKWSAIDAAFKKGGRGLPGESSLADFLKRHCGVRNLADLPALNERQILKWARDHFRRTGDWPHHSTGVILCAPDETWSAIDQALISGRRQLPGGSSLAKLLQFHEGVRYIRDLPPLDERRIRRWARDHFERTGGWPNRTDGAIHGAPGETWGAIHAALQLGNRGLPRGSSLAKFLQIHFGVRNTKNLPPLDEQRIRNWARDHFEYTRAWPNESSGAILNVPGETWNAINHALVRGSRGLPGGSSLADLLSEMGVKRNIHNQPPLTARQILEWADAHFRRHGNWPTLKSGQIDESPLETWAGIDDSLRNLRRGVSERSSLPKFLDQHRGVRNRLNLPPLNEQQILNWADDHIRLTGNRPQKTDGDIATAPGETWLGIDSTLRAGRRGLPGDSSLAALLKKHRRLS